MPALRGVMAGWLADGSGRPLVRDQFIEIRSGRIHRIRPASGEDHGIPGVVDWSGGMVIPELMAAGFSLPESVRCATSNGARLVGLSDLGEIAVGRLATLLCLRGGPDAFPGNLEQPAMLVADGRVVFDLNGL